MKRLAITTIALLWATCASAQLTLIDVGSGGMGGLAPILSSPIITSFTAVAGAATVDTTDGGGTLYWETDPNCSPPTATQIQAGQNASGSAAVGSGNQAVSATGTQTISAIGTLSENTLYCWFATQNNGGLKNVAGAAPFTTYYSDSVTVFAAFTTPPDAARKGLINTDIDCLKTNSVWTTLDSYQMYAAADSQAARVDWKVPSRVATLTNAPTFAVDRGFTTNGTSNYVDTGYNTSTGPNFTLNSAMFAVWSRTIGSTATGGSGWFDGVRGTTIIPRNASALTYRVTTGSPTSTTTPATSDGSGWFAVNRDTSTTTQAYRNGSAVTGGTIQTSSGAVLNHTLWIGAVTAASFQAREWAGMAAGGSLNATAHAALSACTTAYISAIGTLP